jgi:hypothetical protein
MGSLRLDRAMQFYASPAEMGTWARDWVRDRGLHYLFARLYFRDNPPKFEVCLEVPWQEPNAATRAVRNYQVLYLSPDPLNVDVPSINHIPRANPDHLVIWLPQMTNRGLTWCSLGSVSRVEDSLRVYRAIARDVLDRTEEGVWFCQDGRKKLHIEERMRYSPGAARLLEQGIPLCGGGRMVVGRLGSPPTRERRRATQGTAE